MTRLLLWLVLGFVCLLPGPALAQGFGFAPAQGAGGGGGGLATVSVSGSGLSGDGSEEDPLTLATVLQNLAGSGYLAVGTSATPSTGDGDLVASDGTRSITWDASAGTLNVVGNVLTLTMNGNSFTFYSDGSLVLGNGGTAVYPGIQFNGTVPSANAPGIHMDSSHVFVDVGGSSIGSFSSTGLTLGSLGLTTGYVSAAGGYVDVGSGSVRFGQSGAASSPRLLWAGSTGALVNRLKIMHADLANMGDIYAGVLFTTNDVSGNAAGWQYVSPQGSWNGCMRPIDNGLNQTQVSIAANGAANKLALNGYNTNEGLWIGSDLIGFGVNDSEVGRFTSSGLQGGSATGNALVKAGASATSAPAFAFVGDTNTGLHRVQADTPAVVAGGAPRFLAIGPVTLTENTATQFLTLPIAAGEIVTGSLTVHLRCTNGTDFIGTSQQYGISAANKAGTVTFAQVLEWTAGTPTAATGSVTFTTLVLDTTSTSTTLSLRCQADSSMTSETITFWAELNYVGTSTSAPSVP